MLSVCGQHLQLTQWSIAIDGQHQFAVSEQCVVCMVLRYVMLGI